MRLRAPVGAGDRIAGPTLPFAVVGIAANVIWPWAFHMGPAPIRPSSSKPAYRRSNQQGFHAPTVPARRTVAGVSIRPRFVRRVIATHRRSTEVRPMFDPGVGP